MKKWKKLVIFSGTVAVLALFCVVSSRHNTKPLPIVTPLQHKIHTPLGVVDKVSGKVTVEYHAETSLN